MQLLKIDNLNLKLANRTLLNNFQLCVQPGEIWGLMGQNGTGKTSLLQCCCGLKTASQQQVYLKGKRISQLSIRHIAQIVAYMPQTASKQFPASVLQTTLAARFPHKKIWQRLNQFDHQVVQQALSLVGLEQRQHDCVTRLSGGEQQRLAIACVLSQTTPLLLLDEPFNHVDLKYQLKILQHLTKLAKQEKISIIMALHDINLAHDFCDHGILLLPNGNSVQGPIDTIMTTSQLQCAFEIQLHHAQDLKHKLWLPFAKETT